MLTHTRAHTQTRTHTQTHTDRQTHTHTLSLSLSLALSPPPPPAVEIHIATQGKLCAAASNDNFVDIFQVSDFKRVGVCKGPSSYITHVDWDMSGQLLMTNSGAKELLYFRAPKGKLQPISRSAAENVEWETWTSVLGPRVVGVWPHGSDVTDVNASCLSHDRKILATADDFGLVKLFDFPVTTPYAKHKKYMVRGHPQHIHMNNMHDTTHAHVQRVHAVCCTLCCRATLRM